MHCQRRFASVLHSLENRSLLVLPLGLCWHPSSIHTLLETMVGETEFPVDLEDIPRLNIARSIGSGIPRCIVKQKAEQCAPSRDRLRHRPVLDTPEGSPCHDLHPERTRRISREAMLVDATVVDRV